MLDTFLAELRRTPRQWRLLLGHIRLCDEPRAVPLCPLMAVYRAKYGPKARHFACVDTVGELIGLGMVESEAIADAADAWRKCDPALRRRLFEACGLEAEQSA